MKEAYFSLTDNNIQDLSDDLKKRIKSKKEVVIVCVGSTKCLGDSVAPRIGSELSKMNIDYAIFGTVDNPVHAKNICEVNERINMYHKNSFIIAIDACIGNNENIGKVLIEDKPLRAGSALGKYLPCIGDMTIKCIVTNDDDSLNDIDLIYKLHNIEYGFIQQFVSYVSSGFNKLVYC